MRKNQMAISEKRQPVLRTGIVFDAEAVSNNRDTKRPPVLSLIVFSITIISLFFGGLTAWSVYAPLATAAVASGTVRVKGDMRMVQHLEGGIVEKVHIEEGDVVEVGQVLLTITDAQTRALYNSKRTEFVTLRVKEARYLAELADLPTIQYFKEVEINRDKLEFRDVFQDQEELFANRRRVQTSRLDILDRRISQQHAKIEGIRDQIRADKEQLHYINEETKDMQILFDKGLLKKSRLLQLKRTQAFLSGRTGEYKAQIAEAREHIAEAELEKINTNDLFAADVSQGLELTRRELAKVREALSSMTDQVTRLEIKAPISGKVQGLKYHTAGAVVSPREDLLGLVPVDEPLIIEARANPLDIEILRPGLPAQVQLTAYRRRTTPAISGQLLNVSGDLVIDEPEVPPHYKITIKVSERELAALGSVTLYPGMPAEVMVLTGERTLFDYLLSPVLETLDYAMTEH